MAAPDNARPPEGQSQQGEVIPPNSPVPAPAPNAGAYTISQFTQVNQSLPSHIWTTDLAKDYFTKLKDNDDKNRGVYVEDRRRDYSLWLIGTLGMFAVIGVGLWFVYRGIPLGKDIILSTLAFVAGLLAGRGTK